MNGWINIFILIKVITLLLTLYVIIEIIFNPEKLGEWYSVLYNTIINKTK